MFDPMSPIWLANIFHAYIYIFIMWSLKGMNGFKVLQFLVVTDKYFVSWFDSRPGPDMTTQVRYSRCKGTECPVVPQNICQYVNIITLNEKKMQHFWMHRTTCHHYGCTWPSNKSYHQQQPHTKWHVLNERSYRKILKSFHFLEFFSKFKKKSPFLWKCSKNLCFRKKIIDITWNNAEHNATWMCQYHLVISWLVYCFLLTDENNDCLWHVIQQKSYPVLFATHCVLDISRYIFLFIQQKSYPVLFATHCVLDISRYIFLCITHERHPPIAHPLGLGMLCRSCVQIWLKFYHCNCCAVCIIV